MTDQGPQGKVVLTLPPQTAESSLSFSTSAAGGFKIFGASKPIEVLPGKTVWVTATPKHPTLYRLGLSRKLVWVQG